MSRRETIRDQLEKVRRLGGELDPTTGMLRKSRAQLKAHYSKITLFTLFVSDENTWLLRPHVIESKEEPRTPHEWHEWLRDHYTTRSRPDGLPGMLTQILDGISARTGDKHWRVYRVVGWVPHDRSSIIHASTRARGNKTKRSRR